MSIRLRLTAIYSGILALTLLIFSAGLYGLQARTTLREYENRLTGAAKFLAEIPPLPPDIERFSEPRIPRRRFPAQPYIQFRAADGSLLRADPNLQDTDPIPLDDTTLKNLLSGKPDRLHIVSVDGERFLVHNQLIRQPDGGASIVQIALSLALRDRYLWRLGRILIFSSGIVVLTAFGIGWFLAGYALRPINRITQTAQSIGAEQDFSKRVDYSGPADEVGQLATTFNDMLARLQAAYRQMENALHAQKQFVADASHELRTPLTTIRGNLELLQRADVAAAERTDILADVVDETERLIRLVHNLLALARADAGQPMPLSAVDVSAVVGDVCRQAKTLAPGRTVICRADHPIPARANFDALKQVLLALVDNAIRHTDPAAEITLAAETAADRVRITVRDTGAGIPAEQLPHVFDRFYRGDAARSGEGAGLGLPIAKELVAAQGGTIAVASESGQGTTFTVTLLREIGAAAENKNSV